jgi:quercetin dioxygenase-like cupin family protein
VLDPGGQTFRLQHPSEAVYYAALGDAEIVDERTGDRIALQVGSMVHVAPEHPYRLVGRTLAELVGGACPPDPSLYGLPHTLEQPHANVVGRTPAIRVFHRDRPSHVLPLISSDARLVVWPGVGADVANLNYVTMMPGEANTPHVHPSSEDTIYILEGSGSVRDLTNDSTLRFEEGDVIHVPAGVRHSVCADRGERVVSFGGPCPPDRRLLEHAVEVTASIPEGATDRDPGS